MFFLDLSNIKNKEEYFRNLNLSSLKNHDIKSFDSFGDTLLMHYMEYNQDNPNIEIINRLSGEIGFQNPIDRTTALIKYLIFNKNSNLEIIKLFSKEIGKSTLNGLTALMCYLRYNENPSIEVIRFLSNEIGMRNYYGWTALMLYVAENKNRNIDIIESLYKEYYIQNNIGETYEDYLIKK